VEIEKLTALEIREGIIRGDFSCEELVKKLYKRIKVVDKDINAYLTLCEERALEDARKVDEKVKNKKILGKLAGVPIAIKDNICTDEIKTTCASKMLEDFIPPYNASVIKKLKEEDAIIIGKTNMDEFSMGGSTENSAFKITKNPHDLERVPGGSSGGSAAAVASGIAVLSLGSDTGGSIRQPAAFCGVIGLKPTYGLVSRFGLVSFASSLDQIGPITKSVKDCALCLDVVAGYDPKDNTSSKSQETISYLEGIDAGVRGMKIVLPEELLSQDINVEIKNAIEESAKKFKELGAEVEYIPLSVFNRGLSSYYIISSAEASYNLGRYDGIRYGYRTKEFKDVYELMVKSRSEAFGEEVKRRIMFGTLVLSSSYYEDYYKKALKFRENLSREFKKVFEGYDLILSPVTLDFPSKIGEKKSNLLEMNFGDVYTSNVNLAGLPAISIPCGKSTNGLPIGIQIIGDHFSERKILRAAEAFLGGAKV